MSNPWDEVVGTGPYLATLSRAEDFARDRGFVINPDVERVQKVIGLMTMNHSSAGEYFCPCKQSHPLNPDTDAVCPCPEAGDEVEESGHCFCRLFYAVHS